MQKQIFNIFGWPLPEVQQVRLVNDVLPCLLLWTRRHCCSGLQKKIHAKLQQQQKKDDLVGSVLMTWDFLLAYATPLRMTKRLSPEQFIAALKQEWYCCCIITVS